MYIYRYLYAIGLKKAKSLLSAAGDTDLLEQILSILCWNREELINCPKTASVDIPATIFSGVDALQVTAPEEGSVNDLKAEVPNVLDLKLRVKWLKALSEFDRFELMVRFVSDALLAEAVAILDAQTEVRSRYQKATK